MSTDTRDFSTWIREELDDLGRVRDELKVQTHLAKADLRDAWERLEQRFQDLEQHGRRVAHAADGPMRELESDARKLARDLRDGYRRIRDAI